MPEHYTRNTLMTFCWCKVCGRNTEHRVDDRRRGPCLEHTAKVRPKKSKSEPEPHLPFDKG